VITGLLGQSLSHSFSPRVHQLLGNPHYQLFETDDPVSWIKTNDFSGINVTAPYKTQLISALDYCDPIVKKTGSVNCIVKKDNRLLGYNTDAYGLSAALSYYRVDPCGKTVVLLGNGGVARSAMQVFLDLGAKQVIKLCRKVRDENEFLFSESSQISHCDILVNATPNGMYPENNAPNIAPLDLVRTASVVIDHIYNPLRTPLLLMAKAMGKQTINGLYLLVAQAKRAHELFFDASLSSDDIPRIFHQLNAELTNIVFIGLPLSGKSLYGKKLSQLTSKPIIDTDTEIETRLGMSVPDIFTRYGEARFRELELMTVRSLYQKHGLIIACGGGVVLNSELMALLKQNGVIVYLDKDPQAIAARQIRNRPLLQNAADIFKIAKNRDPLYQQHADIHLKIHPGRHDQLSEIEAKLNEYLCH
jgi:shikimate dehydrogenase